MFAPASFKEFGDTSKYPADPAELPASGKRVLTLLRNASSESKWSSRKLTFTLLSGDHNVLPLIEKDETRLKLAMHKNEFDNVSSEIGLQ